MSKIIALIAGMALSSACTAQQPDWQKYDNAFGITSICAKKIAADPGTNLEMCHAGERVALLWLLQNDPNATLGGMCARELKGKDWIAIAQCVAVIQDGMERAREDVIANDTTPGY